MTLSFRDLRRRDGQLLQRRVGRRDLRALGDPRGGRVGDHDRHPVGARVGGDDGGDLGEDGLGEDGLDDEVAVLDTGLRWGEASGLRVKRLDLLRRRLTVAEALVEVSGHLHTSTPKNHQQRQVPIAAWLAEELAVIVAGKDPDDLVFTTWHGKPLRNLNWRRDCFDRATEDVSLAGLTPHELRHTAASLAAKAGAKVSAVQKMLGHSSAKMTLDTYTHLFDDELEGVAERFAAPPPRHRAGTDGNGEEVVDLAKRRATR